MPDDLSPEQIQPQGEGKGPQKPQQPARRPQKRQQAPTPQQFPDDDMPDDAPGLPDGFDEPEPGEAVGAKKELLEEFNKTRVPEEIAKGFWHFNSNALSSSFLEPDDETDHHNLFWVANEMNLKQLSAKGIPPHLFSNIAQIYLHGKSRLKQSKGSVNSGRNNMLTLIAKAHKVVESKSGDEQQGKRRFFG